MADKRCETYTGKTITIRVGAHNNQANTTAEFTCHEALLKEDPDFFRAALDKKWREGQSLDIDLPEDQPEVVEAYISWLYDDEIDQPGVPGVDYAIVYVFLAKLYVFGEKAQSDKFCNAVVDAIVKCGDLPDKQDNTWCPSEIAVGIMYEGTSSGSLGRLVFAQVCCNLAITTYWNADKLRNKPDFAADLITALLERHSKVGWVPLAPRRAEWHKKARP